MTRAFVRAGEAELAQVARGDDGIERRVPRQFGGGRYRPRRLLIAAGERLAELQLDQLAMSPELIAELPKRVPPLAETHPRRERAQPAFIGRHYVSLQPRHDLQLVLDVAQEQVRVGQFGRALRRQIPERIERLE